MINNTVEDIKYHLEEITRILGLEKSESNMNTPLRISKMWVNELFKNRNDQNLHELGASMKVFQNVDKLKDLIIVDRIEFTSTCEHHWLPFRGIVRVAYRPHRVIIGLSKIPRIVKHFSQKPQLQERLVKEIGDYLFDVTNAGVVFVEAIATHDCVACRGIESDSRTISSYKRNHINVSETEKAELYNEFITKRGVE